MREKIAKISEFIEKNSIDGNFKNEHMMSYTILPQSIFLRSDREKRYIVCCVCTVYQGS